MPDSNSNIKEAMERLKQAEAELLKAVYKKIQNSSAPEEKKKEAEEAAASKAGCASWPMPVPFRITPCMTCATISQRKP